MRIGFNLTERLNDLDRRAFGGEDLDTLVRRVTWWEGSPDEREADDLVITTFNGSNDAQRVQVQVCYPSTSTRLLSFPYLDVTCRLIEKSSGHPDWEFVHEIASSPRARFGTVAVRTYFQSIKPDPREIFGRRFVQVAGFREIISKGTAVQLLMSRSTGTFKDPHAGGMLFFGLFTLGYAFALDFPTYTGMPDREQTRTELLRIASGRLARVEAQAATPAEADSSSD